MLFQAPYLPYDPTDVSGFSYETVVKRWPVIVTGIIDQLYRANHELAVQSGQSDTGENLDSKISEGKAIIEKISKLKYQMGRDHTMDPIPEDGEAHIDTYNSELKRLAENGKNSWFKAPWLFAECYLYRILRSFFSQSEQWRAYDPFHYQKMDTFQKSGTSVYQIATTMHELEIRKPSLESDPEKLRVLFKEMIQICLWGNSTDLSLLTHLSPSDIEHLQSVGKDAQEARQRFILKDDQEWVWEHVKSFNGRRVDFVLDNAGFELFTDLVFADFLVTYTPYVSHVVFHPKLIPWFVSDVTPLDFTQTIASLLDPSFFHLPSSPTVSSSQLEHLKCMVTRWRKYIDDGTFTLSVPVEIPLGGGAKEGDKVAEFWTSPWPYWDMKLRAKELWEALRNSGLVIFKGDLNYRKLTGDIQWPVSTSFSTALGPLAGSFPLLSLRTNKADVAVGIEQDVADRLDMSGEKWRVDGRYALISFVPGGPENVS